MRMPSAVRVVMRLARAFHRDERGQALPLLLASALMFVGMGVLVIDFGQMYGDRREAQRAVDLAALAAAQDLPWDPTDPDAPLMIADAVAAANDYLLQNGYDALDPDVTVTITTNYGGDPSTIGVAVSQPTDWRFASILGLNDPAIGARAAARLQTREGTYGIMALHQGACEAFEVDGNVTLRVLGAGILVNSGCPANAVDIEGNVLVASEEFDLYYEGGAEITSVSTVTPPPRPLGWRVEDPLDSLAEPSLVSLPTSPDSGGTFASPALRQISGGGSQTLRPGVYYGGLALSGGKDVTFEPGLYVMAGGGFSISGNGDVVGTGVTLLNTTHQGSCGAISLSGGRPLSFSPPDSGPYAGVTFWQGETCTETMHHAGTVDALSGIIYLPNAHYDLAGNGTMTGVQVIASTVEVRGNGEVTVDFDGGVTAQVWTVALVE